MTLSLAVTFELCLPGRNFQAQDGLTSFQSAYGHPEWSVYGGPAVGLEMSWSTGQNVESLEALLVLWGRGQGELMAGTLEEMASNMG